MIEAYELEHQESMFKIDEEPEENEETLQQRGRGKQLRESNVDTSFQTEPVSRWGGKS